MLSHKHYTTSMFLCAIFWAELANVLDHVGICPSRQQLSTIVVLAIPLKLWISGLIDHLAPTVKYKHLESRVLYKESKNAE
jgi:hypothetical protein